jgi:hypothetical protein
MQAHDRCLRAASVRSRRYLMPATAADWPGTFQPTMDSASPIRW